MPFTYLPKQNLPEMYSDAARRVVEKVWQDRENGGSFLRFFDFGDLCTKIITPIALYEHWVGEQSLVREYRAAFQISNIWRNVAFIDHDEWAGQEEKYGLHVIRQKSISHPDQPGNHLVLTTQQDGIGMYGTLMAFVAGVFGLTIQTTTTAIFGSSGILERLKTSS